MSRALDLSRANVVASVRNIVEKALEKQRVYTASISSPVVRQRSRNDADLDLELSYRELEESLDQWERALVNTLEDRSL